MKRPLSWKYSLVAVGLLLIGIVVAISWLGYRARNPEQLSFGEVEQALVGNTRHTVHSIIGWGTKTYGFDDGSDWIEFRTDLSGIRDILGSRHFVQIPADHQVDLKAWAKNIAEWSGQHTQYEDDSEFDQHGKIYYLFALPEGDRIRALIARSRQ